MPHYKDGTKAEIGDLVKGRCSWINHEVQGVLAFIYESDSCNGSVHYLSRVVTVKPSRDGAGEDRTVIIAPTVATVTLKDFEKVVFDAPVPAEKVA